MFVVESIRVDDILIHSTKTIYKFTRHKFLLVTVKEWLKSVLNYRSYPKNKAGYPFLDHLVY